MGRHDLDTPNDPTARTEAIRRRVEREYLLVTAPPVLDASSANGLVGRLGGGVEDCDVVIDLREVEVCREAALEVIDRLSSRVAEVGGSVTLSHPTPPCEDQLARRRGAAFTVRRPRGAHRPRTPRKG